MINPLEQLKSDLRAREVKLALAEGTLQQIIDGIGAVPAGDGSITKRLNRTDMRILAKACFGILRKNK